MKTKKPEKKGTIYANQKTRIKEQEQPNLKKKLFLIMTYYYA